MLAVSSITDPAAWNDLLRPLPGAHILQTWEWGEFKRRTTGWTPERLAFQQAGQTVAAAQVLTRRIGPLRRDVRAQRPGAGLHEARSLGRGAGSPPGAGPAARRDLAQDRSRRRGRDGRSHRGRRPRGPARPGRDGDPGRARLALLGQPGPVPQHDRARPHPPGGRSADGHAPEHPPQGARRREEGRHDPRRPDRRTSPPCTRCISRPARATAS